MMYGPVNIRNYEDALLLRGYSEGEKGVLVKGVFCKGGSL
jgi:hypothetical protein